MANEAPGKSPDLTTFPLLPLRDVVVFPHMVIPLFVGRPINIGVPRGKRKSLGAASRHLRRLGVDQQRLAVGRDHLLVNHHFADIL